MTTEVDLFNRQAQRDREIEARKRIGNWHFSARCAFSSALSGILFRLYNEGYAIASTGRMQEMRKILPGQLDTLAVPGRDDRAEAREGHPDTPAISVDDADSAYRKVLFLIAALKDERRKASGLEIKAGHENEPQWLVNDQWDLSINNMLVLAMETVNQNPHGYEDDPLNAGPQIHQAGLFIGNAIDTNMYAAGMVATPLQDLQGNPVMCEFAEGDDLYVKSAEALKPFEARLRTLLKAMEGHNLLPAPVRRIEPPRRGGGFMSIR